MRVLERTIENAVVQWWNGLGLGHKKLPSRKMNGLGQRSWPDRLFPIPGGKPFFIEFKAPGKEPTPLQRQFIDLMLFNGYDVEVHDDKHRAIAAIRRRLEAAPVSAPGGAVAARARRRRAVP